jgi:hypothetical protein
MFEFDYNLRIAELLNNLRAIHKSS